MLNHYSKNKTIRYKLKNQHKSECMHVHLYSYIYNHNLWCVTLYQIIDIIICSCSSWKKGNFIAKTEIEVNAHVCRKKWCTVCMAILTLYLHKTPFYRPCSAALSLPLQETNCKRSMNSTFHWTNVCSLTYQMCCL